MNMADKKNDKKLKDEEDTVKESDDIFGEMDDVLGDRTEVEAALAPESDVSDKPEEKKTKPSHIKLEKRTKAKQEAEVEEIEDATAVSAVAEQGQIYLTVDANLYTIDEISSENFIEWVYDKIPGLQKKRKLLPEQCNTARKRVDIFEEVISMLTRWQQSVSASDKNLY